MRMQGSSHTTHTGSFPKHLLKPKHRDDGPDFVLREPTGTYSFSCLVNFTTCEASDMQVSTTTRYREHRVCPWRSALWEGLSPVWFCMVTFAPYSTKVCQNGRDMGSYRGLLPNIFNDSNRRLNGAFPVIPKPVPRAHNRTGWGNLASFQQSISDTSCPTTSNSSQAPEEPGRAGGCCHP